jgi:glycogen synthase
MVAAAMGQDYSWERSAAHYLGLYSRALGNKARL